MPRTIDINSDMGESFGHYQLGHDEALMGYVTSVNVACGFHAGDPMVMAHTVHAAIEHHLAIGAHPGYPDLQGFGRRPLDMTPTEIENTIIYQIGALEAFARAAGTRLSHVKAHGALYNEAAARPILARAYAQAVARCNPELAFVCLATSPLMIEEGRKAGLRVVREAFADRAYNADGSLVSRRLPNSMLTRPADAAEQVINLVIKGQIKAIDGTLINLEADTVCIHGDTETAVEIARTLRSRLQAEEIQVRAPSAQPAH